MKKIWGLVALLMVAFVGSLSIAYAVGPIESIDGASIRSQGVQGLRFYANLIDVDAQSHGFYLLYGDASLEDLEIAIENDLVHEGKQRSEERRVGKEWR